MIVKGFGPSSSSSPSQPEESHSHSGSGEGWEGSLDVYNLSAGSTELIIRHASGDPAPEALYYDGENFHWKNLKVVINGEDVDSTEIESVTSEGGSVTSPGYCRLVVGDRIELDLSSPLAAGDEFFVKWLPTHQVLFAYKISA